MKQKLKDYAIILIFAIIVCIPLFNKDLDVYRDDGVQHIARLMGTYQTIAEGEFPPVIMSNFCNGFGYSWNIFYSPLTAYLPLIFKIFTSSFEVILKLFVFLLSIASGITMYEFVFKVTKNRGAGLLAGILYILAPYRLTDMYMRVAVSELASFVFLPILFQGMYNIFKNEEDEHLVGEKTNNSSYIMRKSFMLTIGAVGLILTHIIMAMYSAIICAIYVLFNIKKLKNRQVIKMLIINILLIILLTAFYTVPMLEHKLQTEYEVFQSGRMERTSELIRNKVDLLDLVFTKKGELCFEIGLITIVGLVLTVLAYKKVDKKHKNIYWFSLIAGILCIVISLRFFPFERLPAMLKMIQFTFRLLEFSSFFLIFVAATNYALVIKDFRVRDALVLGAIALLMVIPLKKNLDLTKDWSEEKLWPAVSVSENTGRVHAGCATFEYLPSKAFNNLDYIKHRENTVLVMSGSANIYNENKNGTSMTFEVSNVTDDARIELPYIYYIGYNATFTSVEGNSEKIKVYESEKGFAEINLESGMEGKIEIKYTGDSITKISYMVSLVSLAGAILFVIFTKKKSTLKQY